MLKILSGVFTDVFYVIDKNVKISFRCVFRPYFRHLTKHPLTGTRSTNSTSTLLTNHILGLTSSGIGELGGLQIYQV